MVIENGTGARLVLQSFSDIKGWATDDHQQAFAAFCSSAAQMLDKPYKPRAITADVDLLQTCAQTALELNNPGPVQAREFFERNFTPHRIELLNNKSGFVTGFYEPLVKASRNQTAEYPVPLLRRPDDLIDIDDNNRSPAMDAEVRFGRMGSAGSKLYFDRGAIQSGALDGQGLELVWLKDKTDAFFIHVQGSAKLLLGDGGMMRVTYAAKSGHAYTSVAKVLCARTGMPQQQMTADKLADWMRTNEDDIDELLAHNQSYIFFKEVEGLPATDGPVAAAKVPLVAGRSLAVDRTLHTFGLPFWINTTQPLPGDEKPFARLMMTHDTGSAIVGPARGDIFVGTGDEAGLIAGRIRHDATMTVFLPAPAGHDLVPTLSGTL